MRPARPGAQKTFRADVFVFSLSPFPAPAWNKTFPIGYPSYNQFFQFLLIYSSLLGFSAGKNVFHCRLLLLLFAAPFRYLKIKKKVSFEVELKYIMWCSAVFIAISLLRVEAKLHISSPKRLEVRNCTIHHRNHNHAISIHDDEKRHLLEFLLHCLRFCASGERSSMWWCHDQMIGFSCLSCSFNFQCQKKLQKYGLGCTNSTRIRTSNMQIWLQNMNSVSISIFYCDNNHDRSTK